jgi:hypothetical protein
VPTLMAFPLIEHRLPELMSFIDDLSRAIELRNTASLSKAQQSITTFFDPEQLRKLESITGEWSELIDHDQGKTLTHVMLTMASLRFHPEFEESIPEEQNIIRWSLLFHDIAKRSEGERDHTHAFRSAVVLARSLSLIGVDLPKSYFQHLHSWAELTLNATIQQTGSNQLIQDNQRIPEILSGLDLMLGTQAAAKTAIKLVLLHHSINHLNDWPQASALTDIQVSQLVDARLLPLIRIMILADSDGWELFNAHNCVRYREETRSVFRHLQTIVTTN